MYEYGIVYRPTAIKPKLNQRKIAMESRMMARKCCCHFIACECLLCIEPNAYACIATLYFCECFCLCSFATPHAIISIHYYSFTHSSTRRLAHTVCRLTHHFERSRSPSFYVPVHRMNHMCNLEIVQIIVQVAIFDDWTYWKIMAMELFGFRFGV